MDKKKQVIDLIELKKIERAAKKQQYQKRNTVGEMVLTTKATGTRLVLETVIGKASKESSSITSTMSSSTASTSSSSKSTMSPTEVSSSKQDATKQPKEEAEIHFQQVEINKKKHKKTTLSSEETSTATSEETTTETTSTSSRRKKHHHDSDDDDTPEITSSIDIPSPILQDTSTITDSTEQVEEEEEQEEQEEQDPAADDTNVYDAATTSYFEGYGIAAGHAEDEFGGLGLIGVFEEESHHKSSSCTLQFNLFHTVLLCCLLLHLFKK